MNRNEIINAAIAHYGIDKQEDKAIEELAELSKAILKHRASAATAVEVIDEIADVIIMAKQLSVIYGEDRVDNRINFKLRRLEARINAEKAKQRKETPKRPMQDVFAAALILAFGYTWLIKTSAGGYFAISDWGSYRYIDDDTLFAALEPGQIVHLREIVREARDE